MSKNIFQAALQNHQTLFLAWSTLGIPYVVELIGEAGWDCVCIDQQHGLSGQAGLVNCLTAAKAADIPAFVRLAKTDEGLIGRAIDGGAQGVICPMINSRQDAEKLVSAVKYPPLGNRSYGPYRGKFHIDGDYFEEANSWTIACAQIESAEAIENLDDIMGTSGLDMVLAGPNDLSISLTDGREKNITHPRVLESLETILEKSREHNVIAAVFANNLEYAKQLLKSGWDVVAIGTDASLLSEMLKETRYNAC